MLGSTTLDIVIGLAFIYLLYSLLATIIQEIVSTWFGLRAKMLEHAIIRMLNDGDKPSEGFFEKLIEKLGHFFSFYFSAMRRPDTFADKFYQHPLIKYLSETNSRNRPSYIDAKDFSKVLIDLLKGYDLKPGENPLPNISKRLAFEKDDTINPSSLAIPEDTLIYLRTLFVDANNDLEKVRASLENWYNETMERATGWYKKHIQVTLFFIGLLTAIFFNVNTISIVSILSKDKDARAQMVQLASQADKKYSVMVQKLDSFRKDTIVIIDADNAKKRNSYLDTAFRAVSADIDNVNSLLALGWPYPLKSDTSECKKLFPYNAGKKLACTECLLKKRVKTGDPDICDRFRFWKATGLISFKSFIGWVITAIAISLGSPFWFDLLNKLIQLRSSSKPKEDNNGKQENAQKKEINPVG